MMKIRTRILLVAVLFMWVGATAQIDKTANVFLITLDGVRWQDVYHGLDTALVQSNYTEGKELLNKMFSGSSPEESREKNHAFFLEYHCQRWSIVRQ